MECLQTSLIGYNVSLRDVVSLKSRGVAQVENGEHARAYEDLHLV